MSFLGNQSQKGVKPYGTLTAFICKGCNKSMRSPSALNSHEKVCPSLKRGASAHSFFKDNPLSSPTPAEASVAKTIPASQPHNQQGEDNVTTDINAAANNNANIENEDAAENPEIQSSGSTNVPDGAEDPNCPVCREEVENGQPGLNCDRCKIWFHRSCLHMTEAEFEELERSEDEWFCMHCLSVKANKIKFGDHEGEENIQELINRTYKVITQWKKNFFLLPRGTHGIEYLNVKRQLLYLFINDTAWSRVALPLVL